MLLQVMPQTWSAPFTGTKSILSLTAKSGGAAVSVWMSQNEIESRRREEIFCLSFVKKINVVFFRVSPLWRLNTLKGTLKQQEFRFLSLSILNNLSPQRHKEIYHQNDSSHKTTMFVQFFMITGMTFKNHLRCLHKPAMQNLWTINTDLGNSKRSQRVAKQKQTH